jgi:hypothetical protein
MHGIKVLIKYHALDVQSEPLDAFMDWLDRTSYFASVHAAHGGSASKEAWLEQALQSLVKSGVIAVQDGLVRNVD